MKKILAIALLIGSTTPALASMTFEGSVEEQRVIEQPAIAEKHTRSTAEGRIGIRVSTYGLVNYVHPGSPADQVGLRKGDAIVRVDGRKHNVDGISGEPGSLVNLYVRRNFDHFSVDVQRVDCRAIRQ